MKIFLLFNGRFPSEKAASLFAAQSVSEFEKIGVKTSILVPHRWRGFKEEPFLFYGINSDAKVVKIPLVDFLWLRFPRKLAFFLNYIQFSAVAGLYILIYSKIDDIIFSNELVPLWVASFFRKNTFYEMHDFPESKKGLFASMVRRFKSILIHNRWKTREFLKLSSYSKDKVLTLPNAVDIEVFDTGLSVKEARTKLKLPKAISIVLYTGHLYGWKGVHTLAETAKMMPDIAFYFVGGTTEDVKDFSERYKEVKNIINVGYRPHNEIPIWQAAGDCLVLPNTAKEDISKYYTSPMKLFEYMASGKPIVASDIPSITEIVNSDMAILCKPDDVESLKNGLEKALFSNTEKMVESARREVEKYTWKKRQQTIIDFIKSAKNS